MPQDRPKTRHATDKLFAEWFWTDRWTGSRGFSLPMEPRGLYREMLTQAWKRGAKLPNDHEEIQRITACSEKVWKRCWPKVAIFWTVDGDSLINETQVAVYAEAKAAAKGALARAQAGGHARARALLKQRESEAQAHA
jgi:uncharacterized protein YdaU (DUF1376 family)